MEPCSFILGAFCLGLIETPDFKRDDYTFPVIELTTPEYDLSLIFGDYISSFDREKTSKICEDGQCIYYAHKCETNEDGNEACFYNFRPSNGCGDANLRVKSKAGSLPTNWRDKIYIRYDVEFNTQNYSSVSISRFTEVSANYHIPPHPDQSRACKIAFSETCNR